MMFLPFGYRDEAAPNLGVKYPKTPILGREKASWSIQPFDHNRHGPQIGSAVSLFSGRGAGSPSNKVALAETYLRTKWHLNPSSRLATTDSTQRSLRSADVPTCVVPRTLSSYGDRTFAAAGPRLWNSLPVQLRNPDITYGLFRRQLKAHLFREAW